MSTLVPFPSLHFPFLSPGVFPGPSWNSRAARRLQWENCDISKACHFENVTNGQFFFFFVDEMPVHNRHNRLETR